MVTSRTVRHSVTVGTPKISLHLSCFNAYLERAPDLLCTVKKDVSHGLHSTSAALGKVFQRHNVESAPADADKLYKIMKLKRYDNDKVTLFTSVDDCIEGKRTHTSCTRHHARHHLQRYSSDCKTEVNALKFNQ
ncbi:hypothetical protein DPMN_084454 [Dreissena polymorpha]|uniref:Uncharacterized protein n=1 Tax=Dreissena polymorpha TaxID=45954 RepID=A0A9D4BIJ7_DREPO|nr:hypothetical protein DPMN_084454 [Dreissena polymorpha]